MRGDEIRRKDENLEDALTVRSAVALGTAEGMPCSKCSFLIKFSRRFHKAEMAAVCHPTSPQEWSASIRDSAGDEPHDKPDAWFGGCIWS
jgi:hypothetical protein